MTEHDDSLSRRYRELAREEPPAALDAAIVSAARRATNVRPRRNWGATVSIAAVLVLGFGISLRMQMEQPGIETSAPASERFAPPVAAPAEPAAAPPPAPVLETQTAARRADASAPPARAKVKREEEARPFAADAIQVAPAPPQGEALGRVAQEPAQSKDAGASSANVAPPAKAVAPAAPSAPAAAAVPATAAPVPFQSPALRSRVPASPLRELATEERKQAGATVGIRGLSPSSDAEPNAELDAIARLREEGRHAEADKALEEFRRRHPDFRIPEAMWERVRPR
jgi:resuscitation-promoting factor RpfA